MAKITFKIIYQHVCSPFYLENKNNFIVLEIEGLCWFVLNVLFRCIHLLFLFQTRGLCFYFVLHFLMTYLFLPGQICLFLSFTLILRVNTISNLVNGTDILVVTQAGILFIFSFDPKRPKGQFPDC